MAYPVHFDVEHQPRYSRLSTFFRLLLVIPHLIVVFFYGIVAYICIFFSWFAILFTERYPRSMFTLVSGFLSYSSRVNCYHYLLTDRFPPFGGGAPGDGYPVQVSVDFPERLSRLTTFFRALMAIPAEIVLYFLGLLGSLLAFFAWFVVIFTGRLPQGLFEVMEMPQRYQLRVSGYMFLLTDAYPWFQEETLKDPEPWAGPAV
jgi:Domain of unknown function (DUF4389)